MSDPLPPLKPFQSDALKLLARHRHLVCVAPTGSGKSRIFDELAAREGGRALLVVPLIALGRQHERRLRARGMNAGFGSRPPEGASGIWIASPEALLEDSVRRWGPGVMGVDECHCCWSWGESFRPAFRALPRLARQASVKRSLWLTATLSPGARDWLGAALGRGTRFAGGFQLPEALTLRSARVPWPERAEVLVRLVRRLTRTHGPGVVYAPTRDFCARLARGLESAGIRARAYHAGLAREERASLESMFRAGGLDSLVATSAFGMGMDVQRLTWVILWQAPVSLTDLAQLTGRTGRSGSPGEAWILWDEADFRMNTWTEGGSPARARENAEVRALLRSQGAIAALLPALWNAPAIGEKTRNLRIP